MPAKKWFTYLAKFQNCMEILAGKGCQLCSYMTCRAFKKLLFPCIQPGCRYDPRVKFRKTVGNRCNLQQFASSLAIAPHISRRPWSSPI